MALTDIKVRTTKPSDKPFKLTDGQGMHLLINPNGSKYWRLQYRFDGKQKVLALGVYPMVSLGEARRSEMKPKSWYLMVSTLLRRKKPTRSSRAKLLLLNLLPGTGIRLVKENGQIPTAREF